MTPSKSMPQKSNHDLKEKCPYIHVGTIEPMRIKPVFLPYASILAVKTIMIVDTSLHHSLNKADNVAI